MRRFAGFALVVALTACGSPDGAPPVAEAATGETREQAALRRCKNDQRRGEETLEAAFATRSGAITRWMASGPGPNPPPRWADDTDVALCYFRSDDGYPAPGPPRSAKFYKRRVSVVPAGATGDTTLSFGAADEPPEGPPNSVRVDGG